MKRDKIEGYLAGLCTAISSCVIVSRKFADKALGDNPDERGPALGLALGACKNAEALIEVLAVCLMELTLGDDLSMYGFDRDTDSKGGINTVPPRDVQ
jgi:hypothetical protein